MQVFLGKVLKCPKPLHAALVAVVSTVGGFKRRDDRKELDVLGLEGRHQGGGVAMGGAGNELPLIDQIGVAAKRRRAPRVTGHTHAGMRQRFGAHSHLDAWEHAGLRAVNGRHTHLGHPLAPGAVGKDHGLGHNQVKCTAALALGDDDALVAFRTFGERFLARHVLGLTGVGAFKSKLIIGTVEVLGLAANGFSLGFQLLGQPEQKSELRLCVLDVEQGGGR